VVLDVKKEEPVAVLASAPAPAPIELPADERIDEEEETNIPLLNIVEQEAVTLKESLQPVLTETMPTAVTAPVVMMPRVNTTETVVEKPVENKEEKTYMELVYSQPLQSESTKTVITENNSPASAVSGGYLAKPSNIYAEQRSAETCPEHLEKIPPVNVPILQTTELPLDLKEETSSLDMQLVIKDDFTNAADESRAPQAQNPTFFLTEEPAMLDEVEEQKRRAAERIQKLRNLSFNVNNADPNNEFETVPAYIRRNLELYNTVSPAENFYSNYEVKADENNQGNISTLNTFLDGKKPD
jgi:cell division protein FtsZ